MRRRRPLTPLELRRQRRHRRAVALLVASLPQDRESWVARVSQRLGLEAGRLADALYPDRVELEETLTSPALMESLCSPALMNVTGPRRQLDPPRSLVEPVTCPPLQVPPKGPGVRHSTL